jgi:hypothetical protein
VAPDSCSKEAEPVMLSPGIDARSGRQPPISFDVHHTGSSSPSLTQPFDTTDYDFAGAPPAFLD